MSQEEGRDRDAEGRDQGVLVESVSLSSPTADWSRESQSHQACCPGGRGCQQLRAGVSTPPELEVGGDVKVSMLPFPASEHVLFPAASSLSPASLTAAKGRGGGGVGAAGAGEEKSRAVTVTGRQNCLIFPFQDTGRL